jgi:hypothetical protein
VAFATDAPGASVTEDTVLTNEQGEASTSWTLGSTAGDQHATATVADVGSVTFTATAAAPQVLYATQTGGINQIGYPGDPLLQSVTVTVLGNDNAPLAGVPVHFDVTTGGGSLSAADVTTDANGEATVDWTLGTVNGAQTLTATVPGSDPLVISATADACQFARPFTSGFTGNLGDPLDCKLESGQFVDLFAANPSPSSVQLVTASSTAYQPFLVMLAGADTLAFPEQATDSSTLRVLVGSGPFTYAVTSTAANKTGAFTLTEAAGGGLDNCATVFATPGVQSPQEIAETDCGGDAAGGFFNDQVVIFLAAGQSVDIVEAPDEGTFDAVLALFDPEGNVADDGNAVADNGGVGDAEELQFTATTAGFYTIFLGTFDPGELGTYTLVIQ